MRYSTEGARLQPRTVPSGPVADSALAAVVPRRILTISVYRYRGVSNVTRLGSSTDAEGGDGVVEEREEAARDLLRDTHTSTKAQFIPIIDLPPCEQRSLDGEYARGDPSRWDFLLPNSTDGAAAVAIICAFLASDASFSAHCVEGESKIGINSSVLHVDINSSVLHVDISWAGLQVFREAERALGNPHNIVAIEKEISAQAGEMWSHPGSEVHPAHFKARRQLRQLLLSTSAGADHARRRARKLKEAALRHRRQLGWSDDTFIYRRMTAVTTPHGWKKPIGC